MENLYHGHRFPAAIISHCVWLYYRFTLSYRDVEEMMLQRGIGSDMQVVIDLKPLPALRYSGARNTRWHQCDFAGF